MKCPSCGARLGPADPRCAYCGIVTAYGAQLEYQRQQHAAHFDAARAHHEQAQEQQRLADAKASLNRTSRHSMWWGAAGLVLCCGFVPSVVGVALGLRARKMAAKYNLVLPMQATAGLLLGLGGILLGASLITIGIMESAEREARLAEIEQQLGSRAAANELQQEVACLLTEKRLLSGDFRDSKSVDDFQCDGQLEQKDKQATLHDVRFELGSDRLVVKACLSKGERWSTTGFRFDNACSQPDDTAEGYVAPTATATSAATAASATATPTSGAATATAADNTAAGATATSK